MMMLATGGRGPLALRLGGRGHPWMTGPMPLESPLGRERRWQRSIGLAGPAFCALVGPARPAGRFCGHVPTSFDLIKTKPLNWPLLPN